MAHAPKKCKECGKEFIPNSGKQNYCKDIHYRPCPICGKPVEVKHFSDKPRTCSTECMLKLKGKTCLHRYGTTDAANSTLAKEKRRQTNLKKYGVENPFQSEAIKAKSKETLKEKYGVEYISQSADIKQKVTKAWNSKSNEELNRIKESRKQSCIEKYGVENPIQSEEIQQKIKATNLKKYGVEYHIASEEVRKKSNQTMLRKYGTIHPMTLEYFQNKRKATCIKIYGVDHPMKSQEYMDKLRLHYLETTGHDWPMGQSIDSIRKRRNTCIERYGVPAAFTLPENLEKASKVRSNTTSKLSKMNLKFKELLDSLNIECELEYRIENRFYDIHIKNTKLLIEIDPTWTHCSKGNIYQDVDKYYHRDKSNLAEKHGFRCIHIFDWDDWDKVINLLIPKTKINARSCKVVYVNDTDCNLFLNKYHLQGSVSSQISCLGLTYNDELVQVMTFGQPRYNKQYQWELLRLATAPALQIIGGASKLFKRFTKDADPESIISYCNLAKFNGNVYTQLGFNYVRTNEPGIWWNRGENKVISNNLLLQRGFDQLFGTNFGKGTSNEELMMKHHWRPVYDCGQAVYEWLSEDIINR